MYSLGCIFYAAKGLTLSNNRVIPLRKEKKMKSNFLKKG